jgi:hypothetical protein
VSDLSNLLARRTAIVAELAAMAAGNPGGNPNSQAAGIDHARYKQGLYDELAEIEKLIPILDGPTEVISTAFST